MPPGATAPAFRWVVSLLRITSTRLRAACGWHILVVGKAPLGCQWLSVSITSHRVSNLGCCTNGFSPMLQVNGLVRHWSIVGSPDLCWRICHSSPLFASNHYTLQPNATIYIHKLLSRFTVLVARRHRYVADRSFSHLCFHSSFYALCTRRQVVIVIPFHDAS